jgi:hypothetical protein
MHGNIVPLEWTYMGSLSINTTYRIRVVSILAVNMPWHQSHESRPRQNDYGDLESPSYSEQFATWIELHLMYLKLDIWGM